MDYTRDSEKKTLKRRINRMLDELGISKNVFKKVLPKVVGSGYKYDVGQGRGKKPSLRQQYSFLKDFKADAERRKLVETERDSENEE